jgi:cytochrome c oxidase assembly protein subunit 15
MSSSPHPLTSRVARGTLVFLLAVILWGSFVRASGSGAGCGNHWPLCNGMMVPDSGSWKTAVEFTHRITSGISLLLCGWVCYLSFRESPRGSLLRRAGVASLILILMEALIGAALVLLKLVESDQSALRAFSMCVHLINTFLLLGAVTLTAHWSGMRKPERVETRKGTPGRKVAVWGGVGVFILLLLGASGAVAALGDTLFPVTTLAQGIAQDFSPARHFLIELRVYHPIIALTVSLYLALFARWVIRERVRGHAMASRVLFHAVLLLVLQCTQLLLGVLNVLLLAPIWLQITHLFCSDLIWVNFILLLSTLLVAPSQARAQV